MIIIVHGTICVYTRRQGGALARRHAPPRRAPHKGAAAASSLESLTLVRKKGG
jgi:hypothetical protein